LGGGAGGAERDAAIEGWPAAYTESGARPAECAVWRVEPEREKERERERTRERERERERERARERETQTGTPTPTHGEGGSVLW